MLKFDCCMKTDVGKVRKNNEDNFFLNGHYKMSLNEMRYEKSDMIYNGGVFAVCDGMGGEEYGERASLIAVETLKSYKNMDLKDNISQYISDANRKICDLIDENNGTRSGTTLALIYINNGYAYTYNVGDSRIYLYRKGKLKQISKDHTRTEQMIEMGLLTREQALTHKDMHVLTQHLGIFPEELIVEPYADKPLEIRNNDILLMCSDGLTDMMSDDEIHGVIKRELTSKKIVDTLISLSLEKGGKDNITVGIIRHIGKKENLFERIKGKFR